MRTKLNPQDPLDFSPARLKVTREYHDRYRAVDEILGATPQILNVFERMGSSSWFAGAMVAAFGIVSGRLIGGNARDKRFRIGAAGRSGAARAGRPRHSARW